MKKEKNLAILVLTIILIFSGCSKKENIENDLKKEKEETEEKDLVMEKVKSMTLDEKIGQLLIIGFEGTEIDEYTKNMIESHHVGGFILFERNIKDTNTTVNVTNSLKEINKKNDIPLFISIDEEGGRVSRMPKEFVGLPSAREVGNVDDEEFSFKMGEIIAERVKSIGVNLDFAPVVDINSNPRNPIIGDRAFGSTVDVVNKHAIIEMKGIKSKNVVPTLKHFPGHGDTGVDSHLDLPLIDKSLEELEKLELVPFKKGINEGADMIMISHILFPKVDEKNPATFSKTIITDILREKLGFDGVVITDDMTMGAITKNFDIECASVDALKAGCDIILVCHEHENQIKVIQKIKEEIEKGSLSEKEIDEKVYRILKLKKTYKLTDNLIETVSVKEINTNTKNIINKHMK